MAEKNADGGRPPVAAGTYDRRREERLPAEGAVSARIGERELAGRLRDRSSGGLFLDLDGDLVFEVDFDENGRTVSRKVRLVRCQRLSGERSGWAVEFVDG